MIGTIRPHSPDILAGLFDRIGLGAPFDCGPRDINSAVGWTGFCAALAYRLSMENSAKTCVLYNATCPLCSFEIKHYARYAHAHDLPMWFDDLNSEVREQWGLDADTAARRLYVLHEGSLTSGISAFLVLWMQMPRYRWLARVVGCPGIKQVASLVYDHVLAPAIYRLHLRRIHRKTAPANG